jgi:hypothetical protein
MPTGDRTITVVRRARRDKLSTASSGTAPEFDITNVVILPRQALEAERGWTNIEGYDLWVLPTSRADGHEYTDDQVLSSDFIRIDGVEWQVDGPDAYFTKGGSFAAAKIQVKRASS